MKRSLSLLSSWLEELTNMTFMEPIELCKSGIILKNIYITKKKYAAFIDIFTRTHYETIFLSYIFHDMAVLEVLCIINHFLKLLCNIEEMD